MAFGEVNVRVSVRGLCLRYLEPRRGPDIRVSFPVF